jgi:hypothetical protein
MKPTILPLRFALPRATILGDRSTHLSSDHASTWEQFDDDLKELRREHQLKATEISLRRALYDTRAHYDYWTTSFDALTKKGLGTRKKTNRLGKLVQEIISLLDDEQVKVRVLLGIAGHENKRVIFRTNSPGALQTDIDLSRLDNLRSGLENIQSIFKAANFNGRDVRLDPYVYKNYVAAPLWKYWEEEEHKMVGQWRGWEPGPFVRFATSAFRLLTIPASEDMLGKLNEKLVRSAFDGTCLVDFGALGRLQIFSLGMNGGTMCWLGNDARLTNTHSQ